ncbi:MAG: hypothetical protein ACE5O2_13820, partial [Armatimonadota bacterium]
MECSLQIADAAWKSAKTLQECGGGELAAAHPTDFGDASQAMRRHTVRLSKAGMNGEKGVRAFFRPNDPASSAPHLG